MTPEREKKMEEVLKKRQPDLTVVFENVWDPHNISACLRSCDAVGIQDVHIVSTPSKKDSRLGKKSSASASKWLSIHHHHEINSCFAALREKGFSIYSTRLSAGAVSLYDLDLSKPVALVFGNEHDGVSEEASNLSDGNFIIPQTGMIQSLNISVACAVTLYEAFRQRIMKRFYNQPRFNEDELKVLLGEWKKK